MAFSKKTWVDRQTEYPARRKLTATGTTNVYDVSREEGLVVNEGDALNAANLNDLESRIEAGLGEKAASATYTATLTAAGWGASAPYTQTVAVTGILATDKPVVDVVLSDTAATAALQLEAWGMVGRIVTAAGQITAYCYEDKPTANIPIQLLVVR